MVLSCCFTGCTSTTQKEEIFHKEEVSRTPKESVFFCTIPSDITQEEAIQAVHAAAVKRSWRLEDTETEQLALKLNHNNYHALLHFTFADKEIRYSDFTTFTSFEGKVINSTSPARWIYFLKRDVDTIFQKILLDNRNRTTSSSDPIAEKLIHLKELFKKNLITESEYQKKREEILSEY